MRTRRLRRHHLVVVLAVVAAACAGPQAVPSDQNGGQTAAGPQVPEQPFTLFDGEQASFSTTYAGEPLVVNFWASWCPPCIEEMPSLEAIHQDLGDEITLVGINLQDEREAAERTVQLTGVTYELAEDPDGALFAAFGGFTMPMTYLVDADGTVVASHGGFGTEQQFRDLIDEHLRS